ncbi:MAG: histidine kinase, partial [Bacteroidota bacterium]
QQLLRAQMNPHFVFNGLNAIQDFVLSNESKEAAKWLAKFASLMRQILNQSTFKKIMLSEEISLLTSYLEIQQLRFNDAFDFKIEVDENIDIETIKMPPMLIQPLVENAIEHGVSDMKKDGYIYIKITYSESKLNVSVTDNGKGVQKALVKNHQSLALRNIADRLKHLGKGSSFSGISNHPSGKGAIASIHLAV